MKAALGRGLDSLIPGSKGREVIEIDIARLVPNAGQPRKTFKDESLKELSESIQERGVIQPIIVSRQKEGVFLIIAGERRFRAAKLAGLKKVPALVREATDEDVLEIALIENIQREDLNPVETAQAFERLMKQFSLTQEQLSKKVGKERATVANYLRLLGLPDDVKRLVAEGALSMGHARAFLALDDAKTIREAAKHVVKEGLSVRETEQLVRGEVKAIERKKKKEAQKPDPNIKSLEDRLIRNLGTKVYIKEKVRNKSGRIEIEYYSLDELQRLLDILMP
jgi:ParB family chromosome partitioning protein